MSGWGPCLAGIGLGGVMVAVDVAVQRIRERRAR